MSRVSQTLDLIHATFDDDGLVANAGLILPSTLMERLGLESLVNSSVRLSGRVGGAMPGAVTVDVVSTICEAHGYGKQGASFGYTKCRCYHPVLATVAGTAEIVHGRLRQGSANTQRGAKRFVNETVARLRRDDRDRELTMRFDSGFWNNDITNNLARARCALHDGGQGQQRRRPPGDRHQRRR